MIAILPRLKKMERIHAFAWHRPAALKSLASVLRELGARDTREALERIERLKRGKV